MSPEKIAAGEADRACCAPRWTRSAPAGAAGGRGRSLTARSRRGSRRSAFEGTVVARAADRALARIHAAPGRHGISGLAGRPYHVTPRNETGGRRGGARLGFAALPPLGLKGRLRKLRDREKVAGEPALAGAARP